MNWSHCVREAIPGSLLWTNLTSGGNIERIRKEVCVAMLGAVSRVQIPKLICHLAHMVETSLIKDEFRTKAKVDSVTCDQGSSMLG